MSAGAPLAGTGFHAGSARTRGSGAGAPQLVAERAADERIDVVLTDAAGRARVLASVDLPTATLAVDEGAGAAVVVLSRIAPPVALEPGGPAVELDPGDSVVVVEAERGDAALLSACLAASPPGLPGSPLDELAGAALAAAGAASALALRYSPWDEDEAGAFSAWLRASTAGAARLRDAFALYCASRGVPAAAAHDLALALEELVDNVALHGYRDRPRGVVLVEARLRSGPELLVSVRDRAPAFDPLSAPPPDASPELAGRRVGGLGVHLVRSLVDTLRYERRGGENRVVLSKRLAAEP